MIESIKLINYQSHIDSSITFDSGINCIIGQSDSGKSAILKAINWIINNKPTGNAFITHKKTESSVQLSIKNNTIIRKKGKNVNKYVINNKDLEAFKTDVPEEVKKIINFSELNFQNQFDSSFLLSNSSGEVAKILNKIINLDVIDNSLFNIEKMKKNYKTEYERISNNIVKIEDDLNEYDWIDEAEKKLNKLMKKESSIQKKKDKETKINIIIDKWKSYHYEIKKYKQILSYEKRVSILLDEQISWKEKEKKYNKLSDIYNRINNTKIEQEKYNKILKYEELTNKLLKKEEILTKKRQKQVKLNDFIIKFKNVSDKIKQNNENLSCLIEKYEKIKPNICPLCGGDFK